METYVYSKHTKWALAPTLWAVTRWPVDRTLAGVLSGILCPLCVALLQPSHCWRSGAADCLSAGRCGCRRKTFSRRAGFGVTVRYLRCSIIRQES